jgi:uncharacterized membrane protein
MDFKLLNRIKPSRSLHSQEAEKGAEHLIERIETGEIGIEVMPNSYAQFTGELEENDYLSYCRFMESAKGERLIQLLEEEDGRKLFEL